MFCTANMINITVSEGYAYDLLAISQIKSDKNPKDSNASKNFDLLSKEICRQVGAELHFKILKSKEYERLYSVNEEIYLKIDQLKALGERYGDAIFIDSKNYERWVAKSNLQKIWFNQSVTEQKFGYKNE